MRSHALMRLERRVGLSTSRWLSSLVLMAICVVVLGWVLSIGLARPRALELGDAVRGPVFVKGWALAQTVVVLLATPVLTLDLFSRERRRRTLQKLFVSGWSSVELVVARAARPMLMAVGWTVALGLPGWFLAALLGRQTTLGWLVVQLELVAVALFACSLGLLGTVLFREVSTASAVVYLSILLLMVGPLLIGPMVAQQANTRWVIETTLLASPLASIASAVDFDVFRTEVLYRLSPLGQRRFDYPRWWTATLLYVGASILCLMAAVRAVAFERCSLRM